MKAAQPSNGKDEPVKMTFVWRCQCGYKTNFNQWDYCGSCGNHRPPPSVTQPKGKKK